MPYGITEREAESVMMISLGIVTTVKSIFFGLVVFTTLVVADAYF